MPKMSAPVRRWILMFLLIFLFLGISIGIQLGDNTPATDSADSAYQYAVAERGFVSQYVWDKTDGGFVFWVDRNGIVQDSKKYSLFQANIILWLGGIESQHHDERNLTMMNSAANYLVKYLYKGNGEWLEADADHHHSKQEFFWNPRSETYIAYALLQAYRYTHNQTYLQVALETNQAQRTKNPTGVIYAEYDKTAEIGHRFPEELGQYQEFLQTQNQAAADYAKLIDSQYRNQYAKEYLNPDKTSYYYHGMALFGKLLYGYTSQNLAAYAEGSAGRAAYWSQKHADNKPFNNDVPGESSDNGRDYYDKRVAMDLIEWSQQHDLQFQQDAVDSWYQVKRFWDTQSPYGFLANTVDGRKTCFTLGSAQLLMDFTPPQVKNYDETNKPFWNRQAQVTLYDPSYYWNDVKLQGIGINPAAVGFHVPWGVIYGKITAKPGPCEGCVTYTLNFVSPFAHHLEVTSQDYFGNQMRINLLSLPVLALHSWSNLNNNSQWLYWYLLSVVVITLCVDILVYILIVVILARKKRMESEHKRILFIDDEQYYFETYGRALERRGYLVDWAADGEKATALLKSQQYALIILDLIMPIASGMKFLRSHSAAKEVPVIVLTTLEGETDREDAIAGGAKLFLTKDKTLPAELAEMVDKLLKSYVSQT